GRDMYAPHPEQFVDLFKYSPTFAVLFAPLAVLPLPLSILLWSALNAFLLWFAVDRLIPGRRATLVLALVYFEVLRNMQRAQSNSLVTALVILAFVALERRRQLGAALWICAGIFVKIFPLAAVSLAIFHGRRLRFALIVATVLLAFIALPLLFVSPHELGAQYLAWKHVEAADALAMGGGSGAGLYGGVMEQFRLWFGVQWPNWPVQLAGTGILLLPLAVRWRERHTLDVRLRYLCSLLVFLVIFNHQSESPSFVIAVTGIAIWYACTPRTTLHTAIVVLTILLVSISSTDITPRWLYNHILVPYRVKTLPCALAWVIMQVELLARRPLGSGERTEVHELDVAASEAAAQRG
ncbi:MAG: glycosyltransferase family 87 protein, partial [Gemmatimonadaceae bacterium]